MGIACDFCDANGHLQVEDIGQRTVRSLFRGHFKLAHAEQLIVTADSLALLHGKVTSFHDWFALEKHDAAARARLTRWSLQTRANHDGVHILVARRSPILGMAIAATNLVLRDMLCVHTQRGSFDEAFQARRRG